MTITDLRFCSVCEKVHLFKTGGRMIRKKADHVGKAKKKKKEWFSKWKELLRYWV